MYFDDFKMGMTVEIARAVIKKEKCQKGELFLTDVTEAVVKCKP